MLPKVANSLLHHTSRAVAAAQNQTGHTIRNVLQLQSSTNSPTAGGNLGGWNGASSSNSGWNSHGTGSGGAKYHAGSRPYTGYTGVGRVITQAEPISTNDNGQSRSDDQEEGPSASFKPSPRRKSTSLVLQEHRAKKLAVLRTVYPHSRSRQLFTDRAVGTSTLSSQATALLLPKPSSYQLSVRYESTASIPAELSEYLDLQTPPPSPPHSSSVSAVAVDLTVTGLPTPPPEVREEETSEADQALSEIFVQSQKERWSTSLVQQEVRKLSERVPAPPTAVYNAALYALHIARKPGESLQGILDVYNEMLARSVLPNFRTYTTLIFALTDRDHEIWKAIQGIEIRMRSRAAFGARHSPAQIADEERIAGLRAENNFRSAMTLFQTACSITKAKLPYHVYGQLLESCAYHSNVDAAIHVFGHLERRSDVQPTADIFYHLLSVYANVGDIQGAKDIFDEFRDACKTGRIDTSSLESGVDGMPDMAKAFSERAGRIAVWNTMIKTYILGGQHTAALGLLEQMLDSQAGEALNVADIPPPASSTFFRVISAFCTVGEVDTALSWFNKLLEQNTSPRHPYEPSTTPSRPDFRAWQAMLEALAYNGRVQDMNRLLGRFFELTPVDNFALLEGERSTMVQANLYYLLTHPELDKEEAVSLLDFVVDTIVNQYLVVLNSLLESDPSISLATIIARKYLEYEQVDKAIQFAERFVEFEIGKGREQADVGNSESKGALYRMQSARLFVKRFIMDLFPKHSHAVSLKQALELCLVSDAISALHYAPARQHCLQAYAASRVAARSDLTLTEWRVLLWFALAAKPEEMQGIPLLTILDDMLQQGHKMSDLENRQQLRIVHDLLETNKPVEIQQRLGYTENQLQTILNSISNFSPRVNAEPQLSEDFTPAEDSFAHVRIDVGHSKFVDEFFPFNAHVSPLQAYVRYEMGTKAGVYPRPEVMARLISALGRQGEMEKMQRIYRDAQMVLASMEETKQWQSLGWFLIEDHMVIGLAHSGDIDAAHVHRMRILEQGGTPSPDAYGALIHNVKDTTDDAENATALFQEALSRGVQPNIFLYNTIISKLAKARRADNAIALFQEMKAKQVWPTSVTYGAVIAACCRVGDATSAETLFAEMVQMRNFRPRVPPYNTMMQLYTHTKPDRARVLAFYKAMLDAHVTPTAHTYKLLMDAYGTIEPVDAQAMEDVFEIVVSGPKPLVQGTHWASLINSYGCVQKNLDRALAVFDSIANHPSTKRTGAVLPDAVVFEALINVLVTLRRTDLLPTYIERLTSNGIHMTAYIANLLIRGYASVGDIARARDIFENLADPPEGVAAPHNHAPHDSEATVTENVPVSAPVYREPSTWETMVRAELGNGNRDHAVALLERAQARKFPQAVYNRISGIMLDESVSPWATA
ncbi:uncharacterized protein LAESUDRAFT_719521 [Laetiporus sulphureus 93-53]|uniref:Pentacotripeptide-repeat region of PRORP domain-containing protein n=1 Tax=Laetiporus sulphureus 93-53 TaxID=1314785 RepID=A0A165IK75_9APHY|nr:uncharacterized protein LAESUDRAFT_719521 [Laetiporus sulphureus 93-53]KZT13192.1 hypothetical protein LAESUDRAFT_719521 [Laetiporus sulphureus 93-53]